MIDAAMSGIAGRDRERLRVRRAGGGEQRLCVALLGGDAQVRDRLAAWPSGVDGPRVASQLRLLARAAAWLSGGSLGASFHAGPVDPNPEPHTIPPASSIHAVIHPQLAALEAARSPSVTPSVSVLRFALLDREARMCSVVPARAGPIAPRRSELRFAASALQSGT